MSTTIRDQEMELIRAVIWILELQVMKLKGMRDKLVQNEEHDRAQGVEDAIDLVGESIVHARSITQGEIVEKIRQMQEDIHAALAACGRIS